MNNNEAAIYFIGDGTGGGHIDPLLAPIDDATAYWRFSESSTRIDADFSVQLWLSVGVVLVMLVLLGVFLWKWRP